MARVAPMGWTRGSARVWSGRAPGARAIPRGRAGASILAPILLQVLGGLLSLAVAGGVLEGDRADADTIAAAPFSTNGASPLERADRPGPAEETDEQSLPESSSDAGHLPANVKLSQGPWPDSSRPDAGPRPAVQGLKAHLPGACHRRERQSELPRLVAPAPAGGSLSPLSPRGPPAA